MKNCLVNSTQPADSLRSEPPGKRKRRSACLPSGEESERDSISALDPETKAALTGMGAVQPPARPALARTARRKPRCGSSHPGRHRRSRERQLSACVPRARLRSKGITRSSPRSPGGTAGWQQALSGCRWTGWFRSRAANVPLLSLPVRHGWEEELKAAFRGASSFQPRSLAHGHM
ncbi:unnamed protein product [Rangifer tarandus platyrhynchus]|uniref:Uncharacterized protein n=1 Tax=Rangifer tarandus platyrhynchus TaxID=3082113 RepID=A0AC59ZLU9_RANTA